ncbi:hypothetical protein NDU88_004954 [Pleurodeles waltl]|uniref:Uncharacterized protein n=1 Tax=Pleurodeles waltl TaxID=8319 RepID=A0AAV7RKT7_PLEWA|nr:hypothetical protein NDU88_004954 [Pleurodeles waltl]
MPGRSCAGFLRAAGWVNTGLLHRYLASDSPSPPSPRPFSAELRAPSPKCAARHWKSTASGSMLRRCFQVSVPPIRRVCMAMEEFSADGAEQLGYDK